MTRIALPLVYLITLSITSPGLVPEPQRLPFAAAFFGLAVVAPFVGRTLLQAALAGMHSDPRTRSRWIRSYGRFRAAWPWLGAMAFAVLALLLGWSTVVRHDWGTARWPLLDDGIIFLPWLFVIASWSRQGRAMDASIQRTLEPFIQSGHPAEHGSRSGTLAFARIWHDYGIGILMAILVLAVLDLADFIQPLRSDSPLAAIATLGALLLAGFAALPVMIRWTWDIRPIPPGSLTQMLEAAAKHWSMRAPSLFVWRAPDESANALATGLLPGLRIIVLSETLLERLTARQVAAVLGHELGHLRCAHGLRYWAISMAIISLSFVGSAWIDSNWIAVDENAMDGLLIQGLQVVPLSVLLGLPILLATLFVVKGRFERQADIWGCRLASWALANEQGQPALQPVVTAEGVALFLESLRRVADLNGLEEWDRARLGPTLRTRTEFLKSLSRNPARADQFDRSTRWMVDALVALLLATTLLLTTLG